MQQLVVVNLTTRSTDWQPPVLTFGESLTLALRFTKTVAGNLVEPLLTFDSCKASIGLVDARPAGGTFALQFGAGPSTSSNTTDAITHDCSPSTLAAAINAKSWVVSTYGAAVAKKFNGSWLLALGSQAAEVPFKVVANELWPTSFGRVSARQVDGKWFHELRLVQGPVSFTSSSDIVLAPAPSVSEVRAGGTTSGIPFNELQQLYIPPTFRGAYTLKKGTYQRTALLSPDMGTDQIQAALIAAFGSTFNVTLPASYHFLIEFAGDFAGQSWATLGVEVEQAPAGDLTFTLPLDRAELASLLRGVAAATLPLEVRLVVREDGGDPFEVVALFIPVTIQRPLAFPELEETPTIDWLRFPSPRSYTPFGADNILTGEKVYAVTRGDGAATSFVITHGLASADVQVYVRQNISGGFQLVDGTDFTATIDSTNQVTVNALTGAPALNAWRIAVVAAKEIASWDPSLTVTIAQVTGLEARLTTDETNLASLLSLLPAVASLPSGVAPVSGLKIELPQTGGILFARDATGAAITDPTKLPGRAPFLLPAIDRISNDGALPLSPLPSAVLSGLWTTAAATLIPGGGHIRSSLSTAGGYVGSDGRILYPLTRSGSTDSYFPAPFELTLFEMVINDMMFSSGTTLTLLFKLALQLLHADTEAQWVLAIEQGAITGETVGGGHSYDSNLLSVDWNTTTPLVLQRLLLSSALQTHGFGCTITNSSGTLTANGLIYKRVLNANAAVPASANFALRARLFNFDTKNSVPDARGWVSWALQTPDNGGTLGAVIA